MRFKTKGLIVRQQNIGERDVLVWVLSESHGIIRAFVRGAKNIKSPKCAGTGLLSYSSLSVYQGRDHYIIEEADVIEQFAGLHRDVENLALAQYFCSLCLYMSPSPEDASGFLRLTLKLISQQ